MSYMSVKDLTTFIVLATALVFSMFTDFLSKDIRPPGCQDHLKQKPRKHAKSAVLLCEEWPKRQMHGKCLATLPHLYSKPLL